MGESLKSDELCCPICSEVYCETPNSPRNLACGHTFCTECINSLLRANMCYCPECRKVIIATSADDLPISFVVLRVVRDLTQHQLNRADPPTPPPHVELKDEASVATGSSAESQVDFLKHCKPLKHANLSLDMLLGSDNYYEKLSSRSRHKIDCMQSNISTLQASHAKVNKDITYLESLLNSEEARHSKLLEALNKLENFNEKIKSHDRISDLVVSLELDATWKNDLENLHDTTNSQAIRKFEAKRVIAQLITMNIHSHNPIACQNKFSLETTYHIVFEYFDVSFRCLIVKYLMYNYLYTLV